ncbi:MAG: hypothetical protein MJB14_13605 [Spirochaetes bacterium]|nr:hypothetical protein [Spirochaetota bacterium]
MNFAQCDGSGKIFEVVEGSPDPNIVYFQTYTFEKSYFKEVVEPTLEEEFHKCKHDMSVYLRKMGDVIKACAKYRNSSKKNDLLKFKP